MWPSGRSKLYVCAARYSSSTDVERARAGPSSAIVPARRRANAPLRCAPQAPHRRATEATRAGAGRRSTFASASTAAWRTDASASFSARTTASVLCGVSRFARRSMALARAIAGCVWSSINATSASRAPGAAVEPACNASRELLEARRRFAGPLRDGVGRPVRRLLRVTVRARVRRAELR